MPTNDIQKEIIKMTAISDNEELLPDTRLNAARRLLRFTNFSARSIRVAKRTAKQYFNDENASTDVRRKAASLLEFVLSKPADDGTPLEPLVAPAPISVPQAKPLPPRLTVAEVNVGWDHPQQPKKFIEYYKPEDLPAFGIPADPAFGKWSVRESIKEVQTDSGVYYAFRDEFAFPWSHSGPNTRVLNPRYIAAYESWKVQSPRGPNSVFAEELANKARHVAVCSGYYLPLDMVNEGTRVSRAPCDMLYVPDVTYEVAQEIPAASQDQVEDLSPRIAAQEN